MLYFKKHVPIIRRLKVAKTKDIVFEIVHSMIFNEIFEQKTSPKNRLKNSEIDEIIQKRVRHQLHVWPEALRIIREYKLPQKQIDKIATHFLNKEGSYGEGLKFLIELVKLGASENTVNETIALCAKRGWKYDVDELTRYLDRHPTEQEAFDLVMAEAKSASRDGNRRHKHRFMSDREFELFTWSQQYIENPAKLRELEDALKQKDYRFKTDLL